MTAKAPNSKATSDDPPSVGEAYQKKLRGLMTPGGRLFAKSLGKSLNDEFSLLSCDAADLIREHLAEDHLKTMDSIKAMNNLALQHAKPRVTSYYLIMNHAGILLLSGRMHRCRGFLSDVGEQMFQVWQIYAYRLVDLGIETHEQIEKERQKMMAAISRLGKGSSFSLVDAVKSLFVRKK